MVEQQSTDDGVFSLLLVMAMGKRVSVMFLGFQSRKAAEEAASTARAYLSLQHKRPTQMLEPLYLESVEGSFCFMHCVQAGVMLTAVKLEDAWEKAAHNAVVHQFNKDALEATMLANLEPQQAAPADSEDLSKLTKSSKPH